MEYVCAQLGIKLTTAYFTDGEYSLHNGGDTIFRVNHDRAQKAWEHNRAEWEKYDAIITSDTCPLARPFLQNGWSKPLLIWVCNRFDYLIDVNDQEFYHLIRDVPNRPGHRIFGFTEVEKIWSRYMRGVEIEPLVIRPQGRNLQSAHMRKTYDAASGNVETIYVPLYGNETNMMDLCGKLTELGIANEAVKFSHVSELLKYKGVVTIPYGWSTLTLFERMQLGMVVFVPSLDFITRMFQETEHPHRRWWFQPPFYLEHPERLRDSEWYCDYHRDIFVYFDSWEDLAVKIRDTDYEAMTERLLEHGRKHTALVLEQWREVIDSVGGFS
jgi:hypothetical protein